MKIAQILIIISMIVWLLPLYKQLKTEYFYFFFFLAIGDPIRVTIYFLYHIGLGSTSIAFYLFLFSTLTTNKLLQKYLVIFAIIALFFIPFTHIMSVPYNYETLGVCVVMLGIFLVRFFRRIQTNNGINLFLALLIFYQCINVLKMSAVVMDPGVGVLSGYLALSCQYLFGIIFAFVNINTKEYRIHLSPYQKELD